eukprot:2527024-Pyramimonas_sp.AAC.1
MNLGGAAFARSGCPSVLSPECLQSAMLEACVSPAVDFSTTRAGRPKEPSRPVQLTRAEEEVKMCPKEE